MEKEKKIKNDEQVTLAIDSIGVDREEAIIKACIEDRMFFTSIVPVLEYNAFSHKILRWIGKELVEGYTTTSSIPSYEALRMRVDFSRLREEEKSDFLDEINHLEEMEVVERGEIERQALRFFKVKSYIEMLNTIHKAIETSDLETVEKKMDKYYRRFILSEDTYPQSFNPISIFDEVTSNENERISTGIDSLDEVIDGGIFKGGIALWIAPRGAGKTTLSSIIASGVAKKGQKVLLFNCEDTLTAFARKNYSAASHKPINFFRGDEKGASREEKNEVKKELEAMGLGENLRLREIPSGKYEVKDIRNMILLSKENDNFIPDVVVIDYFSCLKKPYAKNSWEAEEKMMRELEAIAQEFKIAIHLFEQMKNLNTMEDAKAMDADIAKGSSTKGQIASFIFEFLRSKEQKGNNRADFIIKKTRDTGMAKGDSYFENIYFNPSTCEIDLKQGRDVEIDESLAFNIPETEIIG